MLKGFLISISAIVVLFTGYAVANPQPEVFRSGEMVYQLTEPLQRDLVVEYLLEPVPAWSGQFDCEQYRANERHSLACNIYFEARNQSIKGQVAVALVTRNRVKSDEFPDTYSEVIWQNYRNIAQFSWTLDGKRDLVRDQTAWILAWNIAGKTLAGKYEDFTKGAKWYHANYVDPWWSKKKIKVAQVGAHLFYVRK